MRGHLTHVNFNTIDVIDVGIFISEYVFVEYLVVLVPCDTIETISLPIVSETEETEERDILNAFRSCMLNY